jgi:hypothetical protein
LTAPELPTVSVHYTFVDGYLLAGATRALLTTAIDARAAALTLPRSAEFRAQLPMDGHSNFSGLLYYNLGSAVAPLAEQLRATGILTPEQDKSISLLTSNREPALIYAYGEPERIQVGSRSGLLSLGLQAVGTLSTGSPNMGSFLITPVGGSQ